MHVDIERKGLLDEKIILGYAEHEQDWLERLLIFTQKDWLWSFNIVIEYSL